MSKVIKKDTKTKVAKVVKLSDNKQQEASKKINKLFEINLDYDNNESDDDQCCPLEVDAKKDVPKKKVTKVEKESDNESEKVEEVKPKKKLLSDDEDDSNDDNFNKLNISKDDLKELDLRIKDCRVHYYHTKEKCIYSKSMKSNKWSKPNDKMQEQMLEMCRDHDIELDDKPKKMPKKKVERDEGVVKPKKKSKNELFKEDQELFFEKMKEIIGVNEDNQSFTLKGVEKKEIEEMVNSLLEGMKKYYDSNMSRGISGKDSKTLLSIVKKLCDYHGHDSIKKEFKSSTEERWFLYYIVKK